ncbi:MAG: TetR/AcrR family transcriptional regulator [Bdellovibrionota bacterium]
MTSPISNTSLMEDDKSFHIVNAVLAFENQKGHLKWKVSEVARASKVSKSLVYYYLGSTKEAILDACIRIGAEEFYGLNAERNSMIQSGDLITSLKYTREIFLKNHAFSAFYLKWRLSPTSIGEKVREYDTRYQQKLANLFPHLTEIERVALQALFHGLVIAPALSDEALKTALKWLPLRP